MFFHCEVLHTADTAAPTRAGQIAHQILPGTNAPEETGRGTVFVAKTVVLLFLQLEACRLLNKTATRCLNSNALTCSVAEHVFFVLVLFKNIGAKLDHHLSSIFHE